MQFRQGSPPRMRGKEIWNEWFRDQNRITPAYAGKSALVGSAGRQAWDHPRVCGEKRVLAVWLVPLKGSPPRMRGKALPGNQQPGRGRITPAYAGKSPLALRSFRDSGDHPRVCGEKNLLMEDK